MKREYGSLCIQAAALSFLLALGSVGCLATAFALPVAREGFLAAGLGAWAVVCSLAFLNRRTTLTLLCLGALGLGYFWQQGQIPGKFLYAAKIIADTYHSAYGWGTLNVFGLKAGPVDEALLALGFGLVMTVSFCVCRKKGSSLSVLAVLIPVSLCTVVTDTVPGRKWVFCLLAGLILLILPGAVRRENPWQGLRLTAAAALPVSLMLVLLLTVLPRGGYETPRKFQEKAIQWLQNPPQQVHTTLEKLLPQARVQTNEVALDTLAPHRASARAVLTVTGEEGGLLYLRGQDYDTYDGKHWISTQTRQEVLPPSAAQASTVTVRTADALDWFFLPCYTAEEVTLVGGRAENPLRLREYTVQCTKVPGLRRGSSEAPGAEYLALPETSRQGLAEMISRIPGAEGSDAQKAAAIGAYLRGCAEYDLNTPQMPREQEDFVLWFLQESDRGYCVHFASAAVALLRSAGVNARYVTGYLAHTAAGKPAAVTEQDAHAWAEYYDTGQSCWTVLEATPSLQEEVPASAPTGENTPVELPRPSASQTESPSTPAAESQPPDLGWVRNLWLGALAAAALWCAVELQRSVRIWLRRRHYRREPVNAQALLCWQEAERLCRLLGQNPSEELLDLAQKAKFGPRSLSTEELQRLEAHNRQCLRQLRQQTGWKRLYYRYWLALF